MSADDIIARYNEESHAGILRELEPLRWGAEEMSKVVKPGVLPKAAHMGLVPFDDAYRQVMRRLLGATYITAFGHLNGNSEDVIGYYINRFEAAVEVLSQSKQIMAWWDREVEPAIRTPRAWFMEHGGEIRWYGDLYELGGNLRPVGGRDKIWSDESIRKLCGWMDQFPIKHGYDIRATLKTLREALPATPASIVDEWLHDLAQEEVVR